MIREIIHPYSDDLAAKVRVYTLEEIMVEKIRSLFQRTRSRDLYDVWYLWNNINLIKVSQILSEEFRIKNVKLDIKDLKERKNDFGNAWESSLNHQVKNPPNFADVFSFVLRKR